MQSRNVLRTLFGVLAFAACFALADARAQNDRNPSDNSSADRALQGARLDDIRLRTADSSATLTQLVVVTPDCAFRGSTSINYRRNVNKVGITQDIPLIGGFFAATPRQGQLGPANQLGLAYIDNGTLYVDLRQRYGAANGDRSLLQSLIGAPASAQGTPFSAGNNAPAFIAFSVINRDYQFQVPVGNFTAVAPGGASCAPEVMTTLPPLGSLFAQPVGTAHNLNGQLIIMIKPSIIAGY